MKFGKSCLRFYLLIFFCASLNGQTKNEKEERIDLKAFPEAALPLIKKLPEGCKKLKFYKETDNNRISYEAKFKYKQKRFSLEFDAKGEVEDLEVTVKFKSVTKKQRHSIDEFFDTTFEKSKILKTQKQYVLKDVENTSNSILDILNTESKIKPNYELIAEVKTNSERSIREFTFNHYGQLIQQRVVNPASYEHVLY